MSNFQTNFVAVFMAFFIFAVLIFSGVLKIGGSSKTNNAPQGKVVIWGTFDNTPELTKVFEDTNSNNRDLFISYIKKNNTHEIFFWEGK